MPITLPGATLAQDNTDTSSLYEKALAHYQTGQFQDALPLLRDVVHTETHHTPAHYHLGLSLHELGRTQEGIAHYQAVLSQAPDYLEAWINLGDLHGKAGQATQAISAWQRALALDPESLLVLRNLAFTCQNLERAEESLAYLRQIAALAPEHHEVWFTLGNSLMGMGRHAQACKAFEQALRIDPRHAQTHNNLAVSLGNLKRPAEAINTYRRALDCDPQLADGLNNLALALYDTDQRDEALILLRRCAASHPDYALGWANLGMVLQGMGQLQEAVQVIDRALALSPGQSGWLWNQSLAYLTMGDFARGWANFETRYAQDKADPVAIPPDLPFPMWEGQALAGKRILLVKEQGFGDQIQCLRFARDLAAQGANVAAWVHPAMAQVTAAMPGIQAVITEAPHNDKSAPGYDYWAFMMSLPVRCQADLHSLPGPMPYLTADAAKQARLRQRIDAFAQGRLRVALNWAGNPSHPNDRNRSLALNALAPWLGLSGVAWVSVQKDRPAESDAWVAQGVLLPLGDEIEDFSDTAAMLAAVDLVITVDSAVAHLAGALNVPTWLLLPQNADYRWMLTRTDTPWYPSVRLWRQAQLGHWSGVIAQIAHQLAQDSGSDSTRLPPLVPAFSSTQAVTSAPLSASRGPLTLGDASQLVHGRHGWFAYNPHDHYVGQALARYGEYAEYEVQLFARIMDGYAQHDVIEVGANMGSQSVPLARMARRFVAFEPQPMIFHTLCANLAINSLNQARAFPLGVGETAGLMRVPVVHYGQGGNFGGVSLTDSKAEGWPVQIIRLDDFLPELLPELTVRLLKVDVEGMERAVLAGASALIARDRPLLYVENDRIDSSPALIRLIRSLGYRLYWHCPLLYNPHNFFGNADNSYPGIAAINMLCVPQESHFDTPHMTEVGADDAHILQA